jgi:hypothetical protein
MELSTVAKKVNVLLREEQRFLEVAAKNETEADIRAFRIGELIWKEVLHGARGARGQGQLKKFLPQVRLQKSAAYNYVNLYRGAEDIMGGLRGGQETEETFKQFTLPREYWQILGSTFNDDTYFTDWVRFILVREPLLTDGKADKKLLAEAAKLYRIHRKKPNWWNPKRSELKLKPIADNEFGGTWGYFDPADDDDNAAFAKLREQQQAWERELSLLVAQDRRPPALQSPKLDLSQRLTVSQIGRRVRKDAQLETLSNNYEQRCRDIAEAKRLEKKAGKAKPTERQRLLAQKAVLERKTYRLERCKFQQLKLDEPADCIVSDPPYTKEYTPAGNEDSDGKGNPDFFNHLGEFIQKNLAPTGCAALMVGQSWLQEILAVLLKHDLRLRWMLTAEYARGSWAEVYTRRVISCSKPVVVLCRRDEHPTKYIVGDLLHCGNRDKDFFAWQQDVETFEQVIHKLSDPGQLVVDPCSGTGTTGIAAINLGRRFIGCEPSDEKPEKLFSTATMRLHECYYEGKTWRKGYPTGKYMNLYFDKTGALVDPASIHYKKEDGTEGEATTEGKIIS